MDGRGVFEWDSGDNMGIVALNQLEFMYGLVGDKPERRKLQ